MTNTRFPCLLTLLAVLALPLMLGGEVLQSTGEGSRATLVQVEDRFDLLFDDGAEALGLPRALMARAVEPAADGVLIAGSVSRVHGETLGLWRYAGGRLIPMDTPSSTATYRNWPTLRVTGGRLREMAWLEGDDYGSLSVRAAQWTPDGWSPPVSVSVPGPGTQIALHSADLADGSWMLVWSAFDGQDDEILWSRRSASGWSAPSPVHVDNDVPDIVPAVAAVGQTAVVAWSTFDGEDYRLQLARFEGDRWTRLDWNGEKGSSFPSATAFGDGVQFLYRAALPEGWGLVELGIDGRPARFGHVASELEVRPEILWTEAQARLRWAYPHDRTEPLVWSE